MRVIPWEDLVARRTAVEQPVHLTIGVFDGLHLGHRRLIESIGKGLPRCLPTVVTFSDAPARALAPHAFPGTILTFRQKLERLEGLDVRAAVVIDFSEEMSHLSGKAFVGLLKDNLAIEKIVVGYNFRFGKGRESGAGDLKEMLFDTGIEVQVTEPVRWRDQVVSSSRIRKTIQEADFSGAGSMLAARFELDLRGVDARREGDLLTVRRPAVPQVLPKEGAYRVSCTGPGWTGAGALTVGGDSLVLAAGGHGEISTITFHHSE